MLTSIITICLIVIATALLASIRHIPDGQVYMAHRVGRPTPRLLLPGTHLVVPLLERIARKISLGGRTLTLGADESDVAGAVFWQVLDACRAEAVIDRAEDLISRHVRAHVHDVGNETAHERALRLKASLNAEFRPHGLLITRVTLHAATSPAAAAT